MEKLSVSICAYTQRRIKMIVNAQEIKDYVTRREHEELICASGRGYKLTYTFHDKVYKIYGKGAKLIYDSLSCEDAVNTFNDCL